MSPAGTTAALPYAARRSITAAAKQLNVQNKPEVTQLARRRSATLPWQQEAWEYYDAIGEVKFAFTVVANIVSRVRLYAGHVTDASIAPAPAEAADTAGQAAISALRRLDSAYGGQPGLLRDAALNFLVAGECYLVQMPAVFGVSAESWDIRSVDEVVVQSDGSVKLRTQASVAAASAGDLQPLPPRAYVARLWRQHPRFSDDADSSMLALRDLCSELLLLNRTYRATARSRLNAGALYLPDGLSVSAAPPEDTGDDVDPALFAGPEADDEDDFEEALIEAMTTPISDEASVAAVVPLIIRGPADLGEKIKQFKFERSFDEALTQRADRVLDRIMQGIDVPKDVVTGLANVKYANALQIDENLYKAHIEPLALLVCDSLTTAFLRPAMVALGIDEAEAADYCVWYDPSEVTTRPNKSEDADAGNDRNLLSGAAWRKAHGFTDADAPSPAEIALNMLVEKGSFTPELTEALLTVIAPDVMANVKAASQAANPAPLPDDVASALGATPGGGGDAAPAGPDAAAPSNLAEPTSAPAADAAAPESGSQPPPADGLPAVIDEGDLA